MKARIAVAAFLLVLAVALPMAAIAGRGAPWGFRGHQAVILETAGNVELLVSEGRRTALHLESASMKPVPGTFLDAGDELRAGRYSEARVRLPGGLVILKDGARVVLGEATSGKPTIILARGVVEVERPAGPAPFAVKADGVDASVIIRSGGEAGGAARVVSDGRSVRAWVKSGSAEGVASGGEASAETGKLLVIGADRKPRVEDAPRSLEMPATCDGKKLSVTVADGVQVFVGSALLYPEDGKLDVDVVGKASIPVFGRDVAGNVLLATVPCVAPLPEKPRPPAPQPKLAPVPPRPTSPGGVPGAIGARPTAPRPAPKPAGTP